MVELNIFPQNQKSIPFHPFFQNIYNNPPAGFKFTNSICQVDMYEYEKFIQDFKDKCMAIGVTADEFNHFLNSRDIADSQLMPPNIPIWVAVIPGYVGPNDWMLETEDCWHFFEPFFGNGRNTTVDVKNSFVTKILKVLFEFDNCKGIITHTKDSFNFIKILFGNKVFSKTYFCPQAVEIPADDLKLTPKVSDTTTLLFHGSWNHTPEHFYLRGGYEMIQAFLKANSKNSNVKLNIVYNRNALDSQTLQILDTHPDIKFYSEYLNDDELNSVRNASDIFIIPAYRLHSMSTLLSLCRGNPVICCDGWGFDEYVINNYNGIIAKGQKCSYYDSDGLMREAYHLGLSNGNKVIPQIELIDNLIDAILTITDNRIYNNMRRNCLIEYDKNYTISKRNDILTTILNEII